MTLQELELKLAKAKILRALTYPGLRRVARHGRLLDVKEGQMVIGPQIGGTSAYVVLDGSIEVVMPWGPIIAYLGPGDIFGEMALLQASERTAYCKAHVDSMVFEIPYASFHGDLMTNPVVRGGLEELALARNAIQTAIRSGNVRPPAAPDDEQPAEDGATPEGETPLANADAIHDGGAEGGPSVVVTG